ncbi:MAG: PEP-CTERM sorting domain-containing protein [Planctomycetales bacterium]|nr:PEP-CTERM sorting domain-containing protein [Planctomycetales bacterium]
MRRTTKYAFRGTIAALCLLIVPAAQAGFLGAGATLDQLSTPGMSIGVSGYTFTDFKLTNSSAANNKDIAPESLSVTAVAQPNNKVDLLFQFPGVWTEGEFTELVLEFTALAPDGSAFMNHGLSFGPSFLFDTTGNPYALINETVMPMDPNSTQAPYTLAVYADPAVSQLMDSKDIVTPANKLRISKDFQVYGGAPNGEPTRVLLTDFRQTFMGTPVVPEPSTVALIATGLGMAVVARRRR